MIRLIKKLVFIFLFSSQPLLAVYAADPNLSKQAFLDLAFEQNNNPEQIMSKTLWLDSSLQDSISKILDHNYPKLRLSYWQSAPSSASNKVPKISADKINHFQTVWILEEIGKEKPITFAVSIKNNQVNLIRVLKFRESRGGEIQMIAFSNQFQHAGLDENLLLNKDIDGITGATMSVNAMKKISRLALMLHQHVAALELDS